MSWTKGDLVHFNALALALVMSEAPVVYIITNPRREPNGRKEQENTRRSA